MDFDPFSSFPMFYYVFNKPWIPEQPTVHVFTELAAGQKEPPGAACMIGGITAIARNSLSAEN
jgi:hypothetical protein